ncbi:Hemolysin, chromosomal [Roseovarius sp. THAF8]|uniref:choice-of-anchor I family protein n=1 Tax=Roseovarius sp. THAF8 TaxID=2587846 RepID=UPI001267E5C3|nr:choice-of-anchor I family protein [Roseovarius sp. THAF8]QFT98643.1 Hemolysin, chromosomal [Roseovarius sp. THAF8]
MKPFTFPAEFLTKEKPAVTITPNDDLGVEQATSYDSGVGEGGSEVVSHFDGKLYITNGEEDRIDVVDAETGVLLQSIDLTVIPGYDGVNSVSVSEHGIAVAIESEPGEVTSPPMLEGEEGWTTEPLFTVGGVLDNGYTPPGIMDGIGAMKLDDQTVRIYVNHELGSGDGYEYEVNGITLTGARISYFDIDIATRSIVDGGQAIQQIVDANGDIATDTSFTFENKPGFERFCSSVLVEAEQFGDGKGLVDTIYFTGEETGGDFSGVGGAEWALDVATGTIYALPGFGRGAWENVTEVDTGTETHVAFVLADDTAPFDADGDGVDEAAPLFMYVGEKSTDPDADFLARNGLDGGKLYVWVPYNPNITSPEDLNGGANNIPQTGAWVEVDNSQNLALADENGANGYDEFGYPTQSNLWQQAEALGAFEFSRPEDVATNPNDGSELVLASTGRDAPDFNGADTVGTIYSVKTDFTDINAPTAALEILYDGDVDPNQTLRSPDNLDWADDGMIYIQEDRAANGLFGDGAANPADAGVVRLDPLTGEVTRIAEINQDNVSPGAVDENVFFTGQQDIGDWESSGILDVSTLFGEAPGTLFLADVQAHALDDQDRFDVPFPASELTDDNLKEGGQLLFLAAPGVEIGVQDPVDPIGNANGTVALFDLDGNLQQTFEAGNLPDMVTFSKDGTKIFVANEGEPTEFGDPAGSISVIDVTTGVTQTFGFEEFDDQVDALRDAGVRIFPGSLPSTEFEPEYIAESDGKLIVTLQEANAVAIFDLDSMSFDGIVPLGTIDHSVSPLDASDRDDAISIQTYDNLVGLRMPDAVAATEIDGETYFLTANEGDDRGDAFVYDDGEYDGNDRGDAARVGDILDGMESGNFVQFRDGDTVIDITLDEDLVTYLNGLEGTGLDRLTVSVIDGDTDGDGDIDVLHAYGSRSFTIFDLAGNVVFDSGDDFEQIIAENRVPNAFNNDDFPSDDPDVIDENRSDNKGPEPEAIEIGEVGGRTLAFIGLERDSGIMIYDISDPANAEFVDYIESTEFGNVSPEVIDFIPAEESASGLAQIAVSYEVSGTTAVYDLEFGAEFKGTRRADNIDGTIADDEIDGASGRDTIEGNGGDDDIDAGAGRDNVNGGAGNDTVDGGRGRDDISGGSGDDLILGGRGRDDLSGDTGNDTVFGGRGHDTIDGGEGDDLLGGGFGRDVFVFDLGDGTDEIIDFGNRDMIDMTSTGLTFGDLTLTELNPRQFVVEYGDMGDEIEITLAGRSFDLTEDHFSF